MYRVRISVENARMPFGALVTGQVFDVQLSHEDLETAVDRAGGHLGLFAGMLANEKTRKIGIPDETRSVERVFEPISREELGLMDMVKLMDVAGKRFPNRLSHRLSTPWTENELRVMLMSVTRDLPDGESKPVADRPQA